MRGAFITFEGGEGCGKSTQARLLVDALAARGIAADMSREPGGTAGAEAIRSLLLHPPLDESAGDELAGDELAGDELGGNEGSVRGWGSRAEALLFAAARADHVEKRIRPALNAGQWIICDRFIDSSRAYQGGAGGLGDADVLALHQIGSQGLLPYRTLLIEVDAQAVAQRLAARDGDHSDAIGGRSAAYHARVASSFAAMAEADPQRFIRIDGNAAPEQVHQSVLAELAPLLDTAI